MTPAGCPVHDVPTIDFDHHDASLADDRIWAAYEAVREQGPVAWSPHYGGFWVVSSFDGIRTVLRDPGTFCSGYGHRIPAHPTVRAIPIDFDPPLHTEYRRLLMEALRPDKVRALAPFLASTIERLWSAFHSAGGGDAVKSVALPLPLAVLRVVVGFSQGAVDLFRAHTERLAATMTSHEEHTAHREAIAELLRGEIDDHRRRRPDDYLTWLLDAEIDGRPVNEREMISVLNTLAVAGHETTMNSVSALLLLLTRHRELQDRVRVDLSVAPRVVEEMFRFRTPAQMFARYTLREAEVDGVTIPAGQWVLLLYAAGNRDAGRFVAADEFVPDRSERGHLAFGWGVHQCVGAALARSELRILLETMRRYPAIVPAGPPQFTGIEAGVHYGLGSLPLAFDHGPEVRP